MVESLSDCDICGRPSVAQAMVEGARLSVCANCLQYGKTIAPKSAPLRRREPAPLREFEVVEGYGHRVVLSRQKAGLTRQDLARKLLVFDSVIARVEEGKLKPSEDLARKLESALGIVLLEEKKPPKEEPLALAAPGPQQRGSRGLTLADVVRIKKK